MVYVDIPVWPSRDDGGWKGVKVFNTKAEAMVFIREYFDPHADDQGRVCLMTGSEEPTESEIHEEVCQKAN